MITCHIRYTIDPHKLPEFDAYGLEEKNRSIVSYERSFFRPLNNAPTS